MAHYVFQIKGFILLPRAEQHLRQKEIQDKFDDIVNVKFETEADAYEVFEELGCPDEFRIAEVTSAPGAPF